MRHLTRLLLWLCLLLPLLPGCNSTANRKQVFLEKYAQEDFSRFRGLTMFVRGTDNQRNTVIIMVGAYANTRCATESPLVVITTNASHHIEKIKYDPSVRCPANLSKQQMRVLAVAFMQYAIQAISVDPHNNVSVGFQPNGTMSTDIMRVSSLDKMAPYFKEDFRQRQGAWYERKQSE